MFGSLVRGDDADGSDLDILAGALPAPLFDLASLQVELEDMLGVLVNWLAPGDLPETFRAMALTEASPVRSKIG